MNKRPRRPKFQVVVAASGLAAAAGIIALGCGGGGGGGGLSTHPAIVTQNIGQAGGSVTDGNFTVNLPPNAVSTEIAVSVTASGIPNPPCDGLTVGNTGFAFAGPGTLSTPATVTIGYTGTSVPTGTQPCIAELQNGNWVLLQTNVDTAAQQATAHATESGTYALICVPPFSGSQPPAPPCIQPPTGGSTGGSTTGFTTSGSTGSTGSFPPPPPLGGGSTAGSTGTGSTTTGSTGSLPPPPPLGGGSTAGSTSTGSTGSLPPPPPLGGGSTAGSTTTGSTGSLPPPPPV